MLNQDSVMMVLARLVFGGAILGALAETHARIILAVAMLATTGCATLDQNAIDLLRNPDLALKLRQCRDYPNPSCQLVADALVERGTVRADRLDVIRNGQVQIGMTQIEVVAAWGEPDDRNRYVFASGVQEQWAGAIRSQ